jgi:hypothetical protein
MTNVSSKVLFTTTSPRTPFRIIPEIKLLGTHFAGEKWNTETQKVFMQFLRKENSFKGKGKKDPAFSTRDRITRAPKALGFVTLSPVVALTRAGQELIEGEQKEEIFLRQFLKFQLPSPYHKFTNKSALFWVKPYLEVFRLIRYFGTLTFDELMIFGLQLVDYRLFDDIVVKIEQFKRNKLQTKQRYRLFRKEYLNRELEKIYSEEITSGNTKIRGSEDTSSEKFLQTKAGNMHDYTDALFRYLQVTGIVNISRIGKSIPVSISIIPEKVQVVDYFLEHVDREPCFVDDETQYVAYLSNPEIPQLLTDNKNILSRLAK